MQLCKSFPSNLVKMYVKSSIFPVDIKLHDNSSNSNPVRASIVIVVFLLKLNTWTTCFDLMTHFDLTTCFVFVFKGCVA